MGRRGTVATKTFTFMPVGIGASCSHISGDHDFMAPQTEYMQSLCMYSSITRLVEQENKNRGVPPKWKKWPKWSGGEGLFFAFPQPICRSSLPQKTNPCCFRCLSLRRCVVTIPRLPSKGARSMCPPPLAMINVCSRVAHG